MKVSLDRVLAQAKLPWAKNDDGSYSGAPASKTGSATAKGEVALSSRRQDLIDQPIVHCFERIDKSNSRQFKAILEVLGKQMANAGPFIQCPIANAGQCCRIAVLRTLRGDGSRRTDQPAIRPTQVLYGSRNRNLLTPDYWNTPA